jgi:hypothetical protein
MTFDPTRAPRDSSFTALEIDHIADLLEASAAAMAAELRALGDLAGWRPAPGEWSATEVAGHVIEADRRGFGGRIGRILVEDGVIEPGWDQAAVAAERNDVARPGTDLADELLSTRSEMLAIARRVTPGDLGRRAIHAMAGPLLIGELLQEWVFHDRNHLRQMLANSQARAWPAMGNTQRFTRPDA